MAPVVEVITERLELGEGPHWDVDRQCLYFVDILGQAILKYMPSTGKTTKAVIEGGPVSLIVPVEGTTDKFVISIGRKLVIVTWDGVSPKVSNIEPLVEVDKEEGLTTNRFNDGKTDPSGRLWAGTMGLEPVPGEVELNKGSLFTLTSKKTYKTHLTKVSIANGLAWNTKLNKFYYIDSPLRCIDQFDFDIKNGNISNRETIFEFDKFGIPGVPDGMTIDTDGNLWVAVFNGSRVLHVDPRTGKLLTTIEIPAKQTTSVAFGGPNMDILYVTSAKITIHGDVQENPAGCCFKVTGTGARGLPGVPVKI